MMVAVAALDKPHALQSWKVVQKYENHEFVRTLERKLSFSPTDAAELFKDLKHYLWLSALLIVEKTEGRTHLSQLKIDEDLLRLDEAWHLFLQFTRDYQDFCQTYFGFFLHHVPVTTLEIESRREAFSRDPVALEAREKAEFREMLSWIYDHAGRETVERWYLQKIYSGQSSPVIRNQIEL